MSLGRIFGLMLLFLFFEAVVAVLTTLAFPEVNVFLACLAMTGLAVGVWAVFVLVARIMMRPRIPQAPAPIRPATPIAPRPSFGDDSFTQELTSLVNEANRRLAAALPLNARGEPPTVASLPLYLVIGGEGSGKTSAILNSGLEPRLLAGEATREATVLPTKSCNLWFAEGSIFADISGRVLTQEADNWEHALRVLGQKRRIPRWRQLLFGQRSPSNLKAMVLVCDTTPLLRASDQQRATALARTLSERLQAAGAVFRREFPVYVVFSKCDAVPFFPEFFGHLSDPEGRRLLGVTLPFIRHRNDSADIYAEREGKRLTNFFNRLYMSLAEKRMVLLAREEAAAKKSTAYEFPRELKKIRSEVVQFLLDVFRPNPLQLGPRLRGFYFSGQRWIARDTGPVLEGSVAAFSVAPKRSDATVFFGAKPEVPGAPGGQRSPGAIPRWLFLSDMFHNVVLKDRAGHVAAPLNTREQGYRNLAFAGVGTLLLLLSLVWVNSWRHNRELLNSVEATVMGIHLAPDAAALETMPEIESLRGPLAQLLDYDRHGAPLSYRWGLYSGGDVTSALSQLYFDRFRRLFMEPMLGALSGRFLSLRSNAPVQDDVYDLLKTYRMITSEECKPDPQFLNAALMPVWTSAVAALSPDAAALAERQLQFYVAELGVENPYQQQIFEEGKAVGRAQAYLRDLNGPDKMFRALVEQVNHDKQGDTLSRYAPNYGEVMTGPNTIDAAYTREGWDAMIDSIRNHKLASAGEACVLGAESRVSSLKLNAETEREVEDLYIKNYIQRWKAFLEAHHVEPFRGPSDAASRLRTLADNNRSPLLGLVYMTSRNTDLVSAQSGGSVVQTVEQQAKQGLNNILGRVVGKNNAKAVTQQLPDDTISPKDVEREFGSAHVLVDPANPEKWLNAGNQAYVQALEELGNSLAELPPRIRNKEPADQQAMDRANKAWQAASDAHHALGAILPNTTSQVDVDLKALLAEPITYAGRVIKAVPMEAPPPPPPTPAQLAKPIVDRVNLGAQALCYSMDAVRAKYPFNTLATREASPQDLNDVFAPNTGTLARFGQMPEVSKAYVRQGKGWAPNPTFPADFSQPFLQSLNNFSDFSDVLYSDGSGQPRFDYTVTLGGTGKVPYELDVDGHVIKYNPKKPSIPVKLVWPPVTNAPTRLVLKTGMTLPVQNNGPWSLFRLLQAADDQNGSLFVFRTVQFAGSNHVPLQDEKGNPITVQIRVESSVGNIFARGYFSKLQCGGWALRRGGDTF